MLISKRPKEKKKKTKDCAFAGPRALLALPMISSPLPLLSLFFSSSSPSSPFSFLPSPTLFPSITNSLSFHHQLSPLLVLPSFSISNQLPASFPALQAPLEGLRLVYPVAQPSFKPQEVCFLFSFLILSLSDPWIPLSGPWSKESLQLTCRSYLLLSSTSSRASAVLVCLRQFHYFCC
jgi:hypothetical protein